MKKLFLAALTVFLATSVQARAKDLEIERLYAILE